MNGSLRVSGLVGNFFEGGGAVCAVVEVWLFAADLGVAGFGAVG